LRLRSAALWRPSVVTPFVLQSLAVNESCSHSHAGMSYSARTCMHEMTSQVPTFVGDCMAFVGGVNMLRVHARLYLLQCWPPPFYAAPSPCRCS
jgi:hypothetical protein